MNFLYVPFSSVGPIKFGMSREQVHDVLGPPSNTFSRTPNSTPCDEYLERCFFIYYDGSDVFEAFETWSGATVELFGQRLNELSFTGLCNYVKSKGFNIEEDETGFTCYDLGIGAYVPDRDHSSEQKVAGMIYFSEKYYEL